MRVILCARACVRVRVHVCVCVRACGCTCVHITGGGGLSIAHLRDGVRRMEASQKQASSFSSFFKKPKKEAGAPI